MNTAILIDGAFLRKKFHAAYKKDISAQNIQNFALDLFNKFNLKSDDLHRMYYYDCEPCNAKTSTPVTNHAFLFELCFKLFDFAPLCFFCDVRSVTVKNHCCVF